MDATFVNKLRKNKSNQLDRVLGEAPGLWREKGETEESTKISREEARVKREREIPWEEGEEKRLEWAWEKMEIEREMGLGQSDEKFSGKWKRLVERASNWHSFPMLFIMEMWNSNFKFLKSFF